MGTHDTASTPVEACHHSDAAADRGAGVTVLTTPELWELLTSFQSGYPYAVHAFYMSSDSGILTQLCERYTPLERSLFGNLTKCDVLPHLAIAVKSFPMLRFLFKLHASEQYQRDRKLSFKEIMRSAVVCSNTEALECIMELHGSTQNAKWESNLLPLTLQRDDPDVRVFDWLDARLPADRQQLYGSHLLRHTRDGNLAIVRWLHAHGLEVSQAALDAAVTTNRLEILKFYYEKSSRRCRMDALNRAAESGFADIVRFVVANEAKKNTSKFAIDWAARQGQLAVVQVLVENKPGLVEASTAIRLAVTHGHLEIVKYLHERLPDGGFTAESMRDAAYQGHLEIVQFLHEHRTEGCTSDTLDGAASSSHLNIVTFLHEQYPALKITTEALDRAAAYGRDPQVLESL